MIVVTGAAGFIGSCLIGALNSQRFLDIAAVDDFSREDKRPNLQDKILSARVHRDDFFSWLRQHHRMVEFVFHLGARTDTTEQNPAIFLQLNLEYSKQVWNLCVEFGLPLIYASTAATYGDGTQGYDDDQEKIPLLKPLNAYAASKHAFDCWVLEQKKQPFFWAGLKFFNVYGPNEYHKGRMASVIFHAWQQIQKNGCVKLFRSHRPDFADGCQQRDFIYVKDVTSVCLFLMHQRKDSGIYNVGTGQARTFNDLAEALFKSIDRPTNILYIDTPEDIRNSYQYFTEATVTKLRKAGYNHPFYTLEDGIEEYVKQFLLQQRYA
jgi:ADP-L-glycero-D-manno-heptose 6-epimerase